MCQKTGIFKAAYISPERVFARLACFSFYDLSYSNVSVQYIELKPHWDMSRLTEQHALAWSHWSSDGPTVRAKDVPSYELFWSHLKLINAETSTSSYPLLLCHIILDSSVPKPEDSHDYDDMPNCSSKCNEPDQSLLNRRLWPDPPDTTAYAKIFNNRHDLYMFARLCPLLDTIRLTWRRPTCLCVCRCCLLLSFC